MTEFITEGIWSDLQAAAKRSKRPGAVAVAYFGKTASKLLPLPRGSRLVVDASEGAVKSGQTCPAELKRLVMTNDVRVYSVPNLHAKVFVLGRTAFIGSANVSRNSAESLIEAVVATTDPTTVRAARRFVEAQCLHELGPRELNRLQAMYRPPRLAGGRRGRAPRKPAHSPRPLLPRVLLAQLHVGSPPEGSEIAREAGLKAGRRSMTRPRRHLLDDFWHFGKCSYRDGDKVIQLLKEPSGRRMVSQPGTVVHLEPWEDGTRKCTFVYLELPNGPRVELRRLAKKIGAGAAKRLARGGRVSQEFAEQLLRAWSKQGAR